MELKSETECKRAWVSHVNSTEEKCSGSWVEWNQFLDSPVVTMDGFIFSILKDEHQH